MRRRSATETARRASSPLPVPTPAFICVHSHNVESRLTLSEYLAKCHDGKMTPSPRWRPWTTRRPRCRLPWGGSVWLASRVRIVRWHGGVRFNLRSTAASPADHCRRPTDLRLVATAQFGSRAFLRSVKSCDGIQLWQLQRHTEQYCDRQVGRAD
jgi:hypothetical protein